MNNKTCDIKYENCREPKILSAKPIIDENIFRMLVYWITERSKIHIKKDIQGLPAPWSSDYVFQSTRFTNVRRELDKESKYLIQTVCENPDLEFYEKIANIFLFRMLNKKESVEGIFPVNFREKFCVERAKDWAESLPKGFKQFKKVFMVSGMMGNINLIIGKRGSGIESCVAYCKHLWENQVFSYISHMNNAKQIYETINSIKGIGTFMAYQLFVDITYCPESIVSENEFVVCGPGCKEGLKLLFPKKDGMTPEECLFWLRDNWNALVNYYQIPWNPDEIFPDIAPEDRYMNIMSLENCMCELDKYNRAYHGKFVSHKYNGGKQ